MAGVRRLQGEAAPGDVGLPLDGEGDGGVAAVGDPMETLGGQGAWHNTATPTHKSAARPVARTVALRAWGAWGRRKWTLQMVEGRKAVGEAVVD